MPAEPELAPVISNPVVLMVDVEAAMFTLTPFHMQELPPEQAVRVGTSMLIGLMVLVPEAPVVTLTIDAMSRPLVNELMAWVVASVKDNERRFPV